jgi:hypothetical protein
LVNTTSRDSGLRQLKTSEKLGKRPLLETERSARETLSIELADRGELAPTASQLKSARALEL